MKFFQLLLLSTALLCACRKPSSSSVEAQTESSKKFFQTSTVLEMQVWYEETAAPYTKKALADRDFWDILRENLVAIMQFRSQPPEIKVPSALAEMNVLPIKSQENWTREQIIALSQQNRSGTEAAGSSVFSIYFLNGYFNKGAGSDKNVLGVSLGGTSIIAMFKPVVQSTEVGVGELVPKFVEQSTLVHEMGHALGFVNNGVPMTSNYQDVAHGAHSTNKDDVMYWQNEGAADLQKFVLKYINSQSVVMWGPEVLNDARALSR